MSRIIIAAGLALAVTLPTAGANAQSAIRTYVSITGSDTNPCSLTSPCRHFQAAANATSAGGEVDALDPGGYGSLTINQAITIEGQGWSYVAPPNGEPAITINAGSGNVTLRGLSLNGVGTSGSTGILFNSGTTLNVQNSVIQNFSSSGIDVALTSSNPSKLFVSNTLISGNGGTGIYTDTTGSGTMTGVIERVEIENNSGAGMDFNPSGTMNVTLSDSVIADNGIDGVALYANGPAAKIMVRNSTIANNTDIGVATGGDTAHIWLTRSTITGNGTGWDGTVSSYDDNNIDGDTNTDTAPPAVGYK
jgi:hypothetical protein